MAAFRALLLDFDGVVGNTAQDFLQAWKAAFRPINLQFRDEDCLALEGQRGIEIAAELLKRAGQDAGRAEEFKLAKDQYYARHNSFSFYPGVTELLTLLRQNGIKVALVSGGSGPKTLQAPHNQILRLFDAVLCGADVQAAKPAPDLFLTGAQRLGLQPGECLAIENAPLGIQAAKSAGMKCVAISSTLSGKYLSAAQLIIPSIEQLRSLLTFSGSAHAPSVTIAGLS